MGCSKKCSYTILSQQSSYLIKGNGPLCYMFMIEIAKQAILRECSWLTEWRKKEGRKEGRLVAFPIPIPLCLLVLFFFFSLRLFLRPSTLPILPYYYLHHHPMAISNHTDSPNNPGLSLFRGLSGSASMPKFSVPTFLLTGWLVGRLVGWLVCRSSLHPP